MPGKRINELPALSGAGSANDDSVLIFDTSTATTKRILRSQLAEGMVPDLPLQYYLGVRTSAPTTRLNGDALQLGDYYLDSVSKYTTVYNGSGWNSYASIIAAQTASEAARDAAQLAQTGAEAAQDLAEDAQAAAEAAQGLAENAQTAAEQAQASAEIAEANAEAAKTAAEAARDATVVGAAPTVYATTTAGLAATTSGQYFSVPSADSAEYLILYLNNAGVAVEQKRYPSSGYFTDRFVDNAPPGFQWSVSDANSNAAVGVKDDGTFVAAEAEIPSLTVQQINGQSSSNLATVLASVKDGAPVGFQWSVADDAGSVAVGIKDDGTFISDSLVVSKINGFSASAFVVDPVQSFAAEIVGISTYGQSLSYGTSTGSPISTAQPYDSLKFTADQAGFIPLVEPCKDGTGETPSFGTAQAVKELLLLEDGLSYTQQSYQPLLSNDGQPATTIAQLSQGTAPFTRMVASIQAGFNAAQGLSKTYDFPAFTWIQGENDYSASTNPQLYAIAMEALRSQVQAQAQAINPVNSRVVMLSYQVASHKAFSRAYPSIALAQLAASKTYGGIYLATPMYHLDYVDGVHLTAQSSKKLGFHMGLAFKRVVIDGLDWKPLMPVSKIKQGAVALIKFHVPKGRLKLDTTLVTGNTNYGFNLFTSAGVELTISSVAVVGPDTVKIIAAAPIPSGAILRYAFYGTGTTGRTDGPRGNLRDSQGDTIVFDQGGLNYPAHNWCVMFEETFA